MTPSQTDQTLPLLEEDSTRLRAYVKSKQAVARQVRAVAHWLSQHGAEDRDAACQELMVKLAEDRFTLAVVGQFKRGKSSLMNAIIGRALLPTGILPLTSAITILRFGPAERLVVSRENWSFESEAPVSALPDYVTETGNPGNQKRVRAVYVEFPSPFLRRGLEFVDTPGIGSAIEANTATTCAYIPQCDAVVFVTSADGPLAATEVAFLDSIQQHVRKILFVVNKTDLLADTERSGVLRFVGETLARRMNVSDVPLFPVSSRTALAAKVESDTVRLEQSGLPALEVALAEFLTRQRTATFLAAILDRAEGLLAGEQQQEAAKRRTAIQRLREGVLLGRVDVTQAHQLAPDADRPRPSLAVSAGSAKPSGKSEIVASLGVGTCPVCNYMSETAFDFFRQWQYFLATDETAQQSFAQESGFCSLHTWQLAGISSPKGLSVGYFTLLEKLSTTLAALATNETNPGDAIAGLTGRPATCRVCRLLADCERDYTNQLADVLTDVTGLEAYARSLGVCLRHLAPLATAVQDGELRRFLLREAARRFNELAEDMQSFAMKHEALRRHLENRNEKEAHRRAMIQLAGQRSLCFPWRPGEALMPI